jgi:hypothetical protein
MMAAALCVPGKSTGSAAFFALPLAEKRFPPFGAMF